jgi:hypothetical protein
MLEVLEFIFSDFYIFIGTLLLVEAMGNGFRNMFNR